jgi:hypothetical protein
MTTLAYEFFVRMETSNQRFILPICVLLLVTWDMKDKVIDLLFLKMVVQSRAKRREGAQSMICFVSQ